ncbi:MAG: hypothetical protein HOC28_06030 [Bacteroidetes Order II. Incertae sedis bacterium]|jgi:hypothetical protein|nr:hypothetical protein [Bacteroidetes Order II. bacterium]MDG1753984.1 hypothetical protein [Rhodothermales bacterium]HAY37805.1 hypothetical protein [Bacteroidota bacterium]MBT4051740.1 hypothetical protein [Bacteroidetes Order II. bacterium]MBT4602673.1 hypothetical protein [Bacteroidetes Order II. bacterium]
MAGIVPYAVWAVIIVSGMSLLAIGIFGIRSLIQGKVNPLTIVLTMIPMALLAVLGLVLGDWAYAAILAFLISLALTSAVLLLSGLKGLIGF